MPRPRFQNNARLVLASAFGALLVLFLVEVLLRKSRDFSPDFLASVLLYGLTVLNLTLLLILVFVLGRNLIRALMEQQRGVLGARFRLRLALVFLLVALAPCLLILVVGSDLIQQTVDRWFNVDVERMLSSSQALATALRSSLSDIYAPQRFGALAMWSSRLTKRRCGRSLLFLRVLIAAASLDPIY